MRAADFSRLRIWIAVSLAIPWVIPAFSQDDRRPPRAAPDSLAVLPVAPVAARSLEECKAGTANTAAPFGLAEVLSIALCVHPALGQARASIGEALAGVDLARAAWRPTASANAYLTSSRNTSSVSSSGGVVTSRYDSVFMGASLNWLIYDFGRRQAELDRATAQLTSVVASLDASVQAALTEVVTAFTDAVVARQRLDAIADAKRAAAENLRIASQKYANGVAARVEVLQAETAVAQASLDEVRARGQWQLARASLAIAMGLDAAAEIRLAEEPFAEPQRDDLNLASLTEEARRRHPRAIAARAAVEGRKAGLSVAQVTGKPTISVGTSIGYSRPVGQSTSSSGANRSESGNIQFNVPLLDGPSRDATVALASAQVNASEAALRQVERDIAVALWKEVQQWRSERENIAACDVLVKSAEATRVLAESRYRNGLGSLTDLLAAASASTQARLQLAQAKAAAFAARTRVAAAAGRLVIASDTTSRP